MKKIYSIILSIIFLISCNNEISVIVPEIGDNTILNGTLLLSDKSKDVLSGIYDVENGKELFGDQLVLKWTGNYITIYGEKESVYIIMEAGSNGSTVLLEGYWRWATATRTGMINMSINPENGGDYILGNSEEQEIIISGKFGSESNIPVKSFTLVYNRVIDDKLLEDNFKIFAHRGGGRTSDYLSASENTVEMISLAEKLGANGIEIDVKNSKDGVPFLYHDETINLRLVQKSPIWGNIEDFTFKQLENLITLINGEKIPTLEDALNHVIDNTNLSIVWLDMKSEKDDIKSVIDIQAKAIKKAEQKGRKIEIFLGLSSEEKINQFITYSGYEIIPSLNELEIENVNSTNSIFWGPRWTAGLQTEKVELMHGEGKRVFTWTLDKPEFIKEFIEKGNFDGFITNYPTLAAFYYYSQVPE